MAVSAYVFIDCTEDPDEVVSALQEIEGVVRADGLFGSLEVVAIIEAPDLAGLDLVIEAIREIPEVEFTDTHIVRDI